MKIVLFLLAAGSLFAQAGRTLTSEQIALNVASFDKVWTTVRDKHWEKSPGGLDWDAIREEYRPKVEKATTMEQARAAMSDMLGRLKQTHFGILPASGYSEVGGPSGSGWTGIDVRVIGGQAVVKSVDAGSPAARKGVKPGWIVVSVDGKELAPLIAKLQKMDEQSRELMLYRPVQARLSGAPGSTAKITFLDGASKALTLEIERVDAKGELASFGYLGAMPVSLETKRLGNTGYISLNVFLDPGRVMPKFGDFISSCRHCDGIVIDLRGNPGGIGAMAMGMAGWFVDKAGLRLGTMFMRDNELKFVIFPRAEPFTGPVAILVDGASASTSEILAGGLKDIGRARIFGTRTAAAALPSSIEQLPNGDGFQYAQANYISEGGKPLEGLGVIPDVVAPLTREALLAGGDPALDEALTWIRTQEKKTK